MTAEGSTAVRVYIATAFVYIAKAAIYVAAIPLYKREPPRLFAEAVVYIFASRLYIRTSAKRLGPSSIYRSDAAIYMRGSATRVPDTRIYRAAAFLYMRAVPTYGGASRTLVRTAPPRLRDARIYKTAGGIYGVGPARPVAGAPIYRKAAGILVAVAGKRPRGVRPLLRGSRSWLDGHHDGWMPLALRESGNRLLVLGPQPCRDRLPNVLESFLFVPALRNTSRECRALCNDPVALGLFKRYVEEHFLFRIP